MQNLLHTYLFLIPLVVLILAEITKMLVEQVKTGSGHLRLFHPGGMPSSHSAFVTSLLIIVGKKLGVESVEFAIAFVFPSITWYDAFSSRHAIGEQAKILNRLQHWQHLTERLGHTLKEVVGGILFGALVTAMGVWIAG
ncbi:MAG: divergent PAP2 family protein [Candidatus Peribacteraceae bacterium]